MKVQKYKVRVWNSTLEQLHGEKGIIITEFFIPKYYVCFNTDRGKLNTFEREMGRSEGFEEAELPDDVCHKIVEFHHEKEQLYTYLRWFQGEYEK